MRFRSWNRNWKEEKYLGCSRMASRQGESWCNENAVHPVAINLCDESTVKHRLTCRDRYIDKRKYDMVFVEPKAISIEFAFAVYLYHFGIFHSCTRTPPQGSIRILTATRYTIFDLGKSSAFSWTCIGFQVGKWSGIPGVDQVCYEPDSGRSSAFGTSWNCKIIYSIKRNNFFNPFLIFNRNVMKRKRG